jgi:hypothetical protein
MTKNQKEALDNLMPYLIDWRGGIYSSNVHRIGEHIGKVIDEDTADKIEAINSFAAAFEAELPELTFIGLSGI